jgi:hypothetical protein
VDSGQIRTSGIREADGFATLKHGIHPGAVAICCLKSLSDATVSSAQAICAKSGMLLQKENNP